MAITTNNSTSVKPRRDFLCKFPGIEVIGVLPMDPAGVDAPSRYDMDEIKRSEENPPPKTQRLRHNLSRLEAIWRHYKKRFWRRSKQFLAFRVTLPPQRACERSIDFLCFVKLKKRHAEERHDEGMRTAYRHISSHMRTSAPSNSSSSLTFSPESSDKRGFGDSVEPR